MKKNNINLRVLFIILLSIVMINTNAQTGLNFQGVARTSNNVILASQAITIKFSILQGSSTGTAEYTEIRKVTTNAQGLFTAVIGDTGAISTLGNFTTINWKLSPKFLKIEMDAAAGTNFITMGTTQFQYVAYAQFAKSVDAENIVGIVPVTLGGTGVNSLTGLKTALTLNNVNNTTDLAKPISTLTQTALDLKLNAADTSKYTKQTYSDSALLTKLNTTGNAATATTAGNITATTNTTLTTLSNLTTVGTLIAGAVPYSLLTGTVPTFNQNTTGNAATATTATTAGTATTTTGNAGTATKLATARTINGVAFDGSENINITASADAGTLTGTTLVATVTGSSLTSVGTLANLTVTNQIAGSITGNAATATTAGNITATANTTLTSLSNLATVGTITSGVWSGTKVAIEKGGTGLTSAGTAGQILTSTGSGTLTWTNVSADAGTLTGTTLNSTVTGSSLTSVGILSNATVNGKVIVGASSAASASAVLEASSTTQGFLPPRMSGAQRDAISSKAAGLVVWCTNCGQNGELQVYNGTAWTNMIGGTASNAILRVGDEYQGGIIAYILVSGDPGYDANVQHGLIATAADISTAAQWGCFGTTISGADGTAIGTGNENTIDIMAGCATAGIAARLCGDLVQGGYSDWYLPSKDELAKLYAMKVLGFGGFADDVYCSSTEAGDYGAWVRSFVSGIQYPNNKNYTYYVRAIRAF